MSHTPGSMLLEEKWAIPITEPHTLGPSTPTFPDLLSGNPLPCTQAGNGALLQNI